MNERRTDFELLRDFIRHGDQPAFAGVVHRHLDLVYATALRKLGDSGGAEEVAQNVFAALAKKAWQFAPDDSVPAWLYRTTLLEAKEWLRGELRHRRREQTAVELGTTMKTPEEQTAFRALVPLLDEALLSLREKDRTALLLRFYESQSLRDMGASLGVGEDAAQKRVASALGKLAAFFQRRGFKSATVAATAAALEQTARSAPAIVAGSLAKVAMQMSPPAWVGMAGWLARLASLTKVQTAVVCLSIAALPVAWRWADYRRAVDESAKVRAQSATLQTEQTVLQTDLDRLRRTVERMEASLATAKESEEQRAEAARKYEVWKSHLRGVLMADNYRWPEDSLFVRIPKSALRQIEVNQTLAAPGVLKQDEREILGLTPEERAQIEHTLQRYFAGMDAMIDEKLYETNHPTNFGIPESALASKIWAIPALGDEVKARGEELQAALQTALGEERWPLVQAQLQSHGMYSLRTTLSLDLGQDGQQIGVWITEENGRLVVGHGWSGHSSSGTSSGMALDLFMPNAEAMPGMDAADFFRVRALPGTLSLRMMDWIQQQAITRLGKENGQ